MIAELTKAERQLALVILIAVALCGLLLAAIGRADALGVHGALIMALAIAGIFGVISGYYKPEPGRARLDSYYDDPSKVGIVTAMAWAVLGLFVGDWVAWLLVNPDLTFDAGWSSFGRIRPVHTTAVIFGFGGNALIATSFYVMQRTSRVRMPDQLSPWFVLLGYNLFCILAVTGYMLGLTQSREYAEPEWYADIWLVIVWVVYFVLYLRTLARRKEPHIYVSNWYYLAFILVVAILHIVNNLAVPVSFGHAKSYSLFSGVQDAMTEWWYGHNAVAFFLTSGFLVGDALHAVEHRLRNDHAGHLVREEQRVAVAGQRPHAQQHGHVGLLQVVEEALQLVGLLGHLAVHHLHRDRAVEGGVAGQVDGRHPARAEFRLEPVAAREHGADHPRAGLGAVRHQSVELVGGIGSV